MSPRFVRDADVLWRSSGRAVLAVGASGEVFELGGGAAAVWECLERPSSSPQIAADLGAPAHEVAELITHLAELGIVRQVR